MSFKFTFEHAEMWEFLNKARVFIKMIELWVKIGSIEIQKILNKINKKK